jgi:O-antigen ligase
MGTQASSGFWIGNISQFSGGEQSPSYLLVANNLSLVFLAFLFHSFPQKKKEPAEGK